jgi:tRNA1(Val) A37 N6-methylase TrmN6
MIKAKIKLLLHSILGFERFLYYFSLFKIRTLRSDKNEKDIFLFTEKINEQNSEGIVLDIGANIGIMTGAIAQNTKAYIHAFEPLPLNSKIFERVVEKLKLTERVTLHKMALGNTEGFL